MDFRQMIAAQNARMEPFSRAKAAETGDTQYLVVLETKAKALASNKLAYSTMKTVILTSQKKNVAPRNAASLLYATVKAQKAALKALEYSGTEYYLVSPSEFHRNNDIAIKAIDFSTKSVEALCIAFEESLKMDEDAINAGIAAYISAKKNGLSDSAAHNAACNAKYKRKWFFNRIYFQMIVPKSYWINMM